MQLRLVTIATPGFRHSKSHDGTFVVTDGSRGRVVTDEEWDVMTTLKLGCRV